MKIVLLGSDCGSFEMSKKYTGVNNGITKVYAKVKELGAEITDCVQENYKTHKVKKGDEKQIAKADICVKMGKCYDDMVEAANEHKRELVELEPFLIALFGEK